VTGPVSRDSEDNFNIRRVRERARAKAAALRNSTPSPLMEGEEDCNQDAGVLPNPHLEIPTPAPDEFAGVGDDQENILGDQAFYRFTLPNGGGGTHYTAIPPYPGSPSAADRFTEVRDEVLGGWVPLPPGHCAPRNAEGDHRAAEAAEASQRQTGEESSGSDSNYSEGRRAKEKERAKKRSSGRPASDTEEEDEEDDKELADGAIPESTNVQSRRRTLNHDTPTPRFTSAQKGKGRRVQNEQSMNVDTRESPDEDSMGPPFTQAEKGRNRQIEEDHDGMEVDAEGVPEVIADQQPAKAPRRRSDAEQREVEGFGLRVSEEAQVLARRWHRQPREILFAAGLGTRLSRGENTYNDYKNWYSSVHTKPKHSKLLHIYITCPAHGCPSVRTRLEPCDDERL
jgi:hypothetical protein